MTDIRISDKDIQEWTRRKTELEAEISSILNYPFGDCTKHYPDTKPPRTIESVISFVSDRNAYLHLAR